MNASSLEKLKKEVFEANLRLASEGLVVRTWGNASGVDRRREVMVIKPSGVPYKKLRPSDMVVVDLSTGAPVGKTLRPSSDAPTHRILYQAFEGVGGIVHTHSRYATAWAQAMRSIPPLGTTHADHFLGPIPCTRPMVVDEMTAEYEENTGRVIVESLTERSAMTIPAILVASHGPYAWGSTVAEAVDNAFVLEHVACMAFETLVINPQIPGMSQTLLTKHYGRKHGPQAYYGQGKRDETRRSKRR